MWKEESIDLKLTRFFEISARALLSMLVAAILCALVAGTLRTFADIPAVFRGEFHHAFRTVMVDILTVMSVVELLRTALAYFTEGRVKVTYIIDTVIVTVLTEVMAFWYRDLSWDRVGMVIALVLSLAAVRISAVRYSPRRAADGF